MSMFNRIYKEKKEQTSEEENSVLDNYCVIDVRFIGEGLQRVVLSEDSYKRLRDNYKWENPKQYLELFYMFVDNLDMDKDCLAVVFNKAIWNLNTIKMCYLYEERNDKILDD